MKSRLLLAWFCLPSALTGAQTVQSGVTYADDIALNPISQFPSIVMVLITVCITISVALALTWAGKSGQFEKMSSSAETIFDEGEPVGLVTDHFPERKPRKPQNQPTS